MNELYIGLISGTSADGIDAALVDFSQPRPCIVATHYVSYSLLIREKIFALYEKGENEIQRLGELDILLGQAFAEAVITLLKQQSLPPTSIKAIGSHGQTIRHYPHAPYRFTVQVGDPNTIACETGITTIADFRRKDMAYGGQGAPLVPAFHHYLFSSAMTDRVIINIGGIANITVLPKKNVESIIGFDTGPGNTLLDAWIHLHQSKKQDDGGKWGAQGKVQPDLLEHLLSDIYFQQAPPKSTGREYFNLVWLQKKLSALKTEISPVDVQATLVEFTALTIILSIRQQLPSAEILVCGGGTHNHYLMSRLQEIAKPQFIVSSTQEFGVDPDWVEAIAFAWLARQTLHHQPGNLPSVTGAQKAAILGGVYYA
ncbi:MAG: anhydro-N-acetylmuramic acid kinase [Gammaproteobacteria bacterium RIFCSPHIGHO2_12_FULL_37_14]|nr:MAG: anhydro-N-acetylmuramic acid kinase [Gammaproteobacteria bacterium RIFCSPHIGHO2_12_FULL_37_14]